MDASLPRVELGALVPLPSLRTNVGKEMGMAVCPTLGLLVTSNTGDNTLSVFALPRTIGAGAGAGAGGGAGCDLARVCTLGGAGSPAPMQFKFWDSSYTGRTSGWMAFTGPASARLLVVTDAGHDAVHVIDVAGRVHVGYVAAPGAIDGPRGVAGGAPWWPSARGEEAAMTTWSCSRAAEPAGQQCARWLVASGVLAMQAGSFGGPMACGSLLTARGWRWRIRATAV